jgi:serine/threonine protein kinase
MNLGNGAYSEVYKVMRFSDKKEYALKKVKKRRILIKFRLKWGPYLIRRRRTP